MQMPFAPLLLELGQMDRDELVSFEQGGPEGHKQLQLIILLVFLLLNVLANVGVIMVVMKDRELRSMPRILATASLAIADLLMVIVMIFKMWSLYAQTTKTTCNIFGTFLVFFLQISMLHLFALSIDSYIAVFRPLKYRQIVTRKRFGTVLITIWLICILTFSVLPSLLKEANDVRIQSLFYGCYAFHGERTNPRYRTIAYAHAVIFFITPITCMLVVYHKIAKVSWYQSRKRGPKSCRGLKWKLTIGKYF